MAIICETSAILNCCYTAIIPIEITACDDTCFQKIQRINNINNHLGIIEKPKQNESNDMANIDCRNIT